MAESPDEVLLFRLAAGEGAAFAVLYDRYGDRLFRVARALTGSRDEAEDAVQDVFVGLVQAGRRLARVESLQAYLFAALRHAAARRRERRQKLSTQPLEEAHAVAGPQGPASVSETDVRLERALASLPPAQLEAVVLKVDGGLTFAELAAALGVSENTAASRYRYALEKLRKALNEVRDEPS